MVPETLVKITADAQIELFDDLERGTIFRTSDSVYIKIVNGAVDLADGTHYSAAATFVGTRCVVFPFVEINCHSKEPASE
jgi:hypothetical protein